VLEDHPSPGNDARRLGAEGDSEARRHHPVQRSGGVALLDHGRAEAIALAELDAVGEEPRRGAPRDEDESFIGQLREVDPLLPGQSMVLG